jgi:hypothetical protein
MSLSDLFEERKEGSGRLAFQFDQSAQGERLQRDSQAVQLVDVTGIQFSHDTAPPRPIHDKAPTLELRQRIPYGTPACAESFSELTLDKPISASQFSGENQCPDRIGYDRSEI